MNRNSLFEARSVAPSESNKPKLAKYMPYCGKEIADALEGYPDYLIGPYPRALWKYWSGNCEGLPNNMEFLQNVCHLETPEWERVKDILFGLLFYKDENDLWQYPPLREEYARSIDRHDKLVNAANKRWGKFPPPKRTV
jgi:hypothetical protein